MPAGLMALQRVRSPVRLLTSQTSLVWRAAAVGAVLSCHSRAAAAATACACPRAGDGVTATRVSVRPPCLPKCQAIRENRKTIY